MHGNLIITGLHFRIILVVVMRDHVIIMWVLVKINFTFNRDCYESCHFIRYFNKL